MSELESATDSMIIFCLHFYASIMDKRFYKSNVSNSVLLSYFIAFIQDEVPFPMRSAKMSGTNGVGY